MGEQFNLSFVKFLDVKSPVGICQREKEDRSIGIDLYIPKCDEKFFEAFIELNKKKYPELSFKKQWQEVYDKFGNLLIKFEGDDWDELLIYQDVIIPTGIGLLIPEGYHVANKPKSGNFNNHYTSIEGLIDENYTYGMGIQLHILGNDNVLLFSTGEKISQIILEKSYPITTLNEIPLEEWNSLPSVVERRNERTGGFGHTGKF